MPFWLVWPIFGAIAGHAASPSYASEEERLVRALVVATAALLIYLAWRIARWLWRATTRTLPGVTEQAAYGAGRLSARAEASVKRTVRAFRDGRES